MSYSSLFEIDKSSDETFKYTVYFKPLESTAPAYTVSSAVVHVYDSSGNDLSSSLLGPSPTTVFQNSVTFEVTGGTTGNKYTIKAAATMSTGEILVASGYMKVHDL